jgi:bacillithiol biosynthesis cysteine-adding enzyme BshC
VEDYLAGHQNLRPFFRFTPDDKGLKQAIETRKRFPVDRETLELVIREQYLGYELSPLLSANIEALRSDNTFTVCTAHQPNLLTGHLYFFYKIIHAVKLAQHLKAGSPEHNFVPVFYIGSEDNDLDELGHFYFGEKKFTWETRQTGAVGRMNTQDLKPLIEELKQTLGPPNENTQRLNQVVSDAYEGKMTIAEATRNIIHAFLNDYGLVVLDADDARLKRSFLPVMREELVDPKAVGLVTETSQKLNEHYKVQAYARPINLFYLKDDIRERIEKQGNKWQVLETSISFTKEELIAELEAHPERFSPNVILRGLYQEAILPDVAFIGGGSEVAYWMQLRPVFDHYRIFFPALILRQSALWMDKNDVRWQQQLGLADSTVFKPAEEIAAELVRGSTTQTLDLNKESESIDAAMTAIKAKATAVDATLNAAAEATLVKISRLLERLEKKMFRAEKRHYADQIRQIDTLKGKLFPGRQLQERHDNFLAYYIQYGPAFFSLLLDATLPFGDRFLILKPE